MQIFGQNPDRIVDGYSEEFESTFLEHMKRSHRFSRIAATVVYNEYIADRHHVHMNSTKWLSLTEFVKYLGRTGKCKVEETPKGWFITYIDRDSETLFKDRMKNKRIKADLAEDEKKEREIMKQIERAEQLMPVVDNVQVTEEREKKRAKRGDESAVGKSALEELIKEDEKVKECRNRKDYWLCEGIIVKVLSKKLADKGYYKKKGVVKKVIDKYVGEIEMLDTKHVLRVDQAELETVIPQIGGLVRIVNGAYRGSNARLLSIDTDKYCAKVQLEKGLYDGRVLQAVDYEDICKVA